MARKPISLLIGILVVLAGCRARTVRFTVVPSNPHYLLRSPDGQSRAFPETTERFSSANDGWIDLTPGLTLQVSRVYFQPAESRRIQDYLGEEILRLEAQGGSLRTIDFRPLPARPNGQPSVEATIPPPHRTARFHRLFFQVALDSTSGPARAVLLSAESQSAIGTFSHRLLRGTGCSATTEPEVHCLVIPEGTTASVLCNVVVNGKPLTVPWGTTVLGVVSSARPVRLSRQFRNRMAPVQLDSTDQDALRLPLLPGDVLEYGRQ